jgi:membrane-associated protease RseP (regulator of RpoE activity)
MVRTLASVIVLVITCAAPRVTSAQAVNCETTGKVLYARDVMDRFYLWYDRMPAVDPARYESPEAYLAAVRYRPIDESFSWITSRESFDALFRSSQSVGIGFSTEVRGGEMRVLQVFPGSAGADAGLSRGDRIVEINGQAVAALIASGQINSALGEAEDGIEVDIAFITAAGTRRTARIVKRAYTIPTVSHTRVYTAGSRRVGYIFLRNFVEPSVEALDAAFATLAAARIDDLVLDLRYNGGGLVNVAQHLASYIGGIRTEGRIFGEYFHNDKQTALNRILRFENKPPVAPFDRLIVITTGRSASASELVINGLRPFMPVILIGDRTYGKPVGQRVFTFCDKALAPVTFVLRNANGEADFFGGFAPTCSAADDVDFQLGDPGEASLKEALIFAGTGACTPTPAGTRQRVERARTEKTEGWQSVVNAQ